MSEKIKPCPFCGSAANLESNFGREFWIQCDEDHCDGIVYESPQEAIEAWNKRKPTYDETKWKLVPVEPTTSMLNAGRESRPDGKFAGQCGAVWRAMLAAAPTHDAAKEAPDAPR